MSTPPPMTDAQIEYENELIAVFTGLVETIGMPPSLGAIYGLLFASLESLTMDEITARLQISKGSASQGLRQLEDIGAVFRERADGERINRYTASQKLKNLTAAFLRERVLPSVERGSQRIQRIRTLVPNLEPSRQDAARKRLDKLTRWHSRASSLLPFLQRFLQSD